MSVVGLEPSISEILPTADRNAVPYVDGTEGMGKMDFLKLLITQLKNQDPLNPMEGVEFTAQLAQFTSLEQLYNINSNFTAMSTMLTAQYNFGTINLVGKEVKAAGDNLSVADGVSTSGIVTLEEAAANVEVRIYDADSTVVGTLNLGPLGAGEHPFEWEAKDARGNAVKDGNYAFVVTAVDQNGNSVETTSSIKGRVSGVTFTAGGAATLLLNNLKVDMQDVYEVVEPETALE